MACLYLFILFVGSAHAQIATTIVDQATNVPLSKASISLQNLKDSIINKTATSERGVFSCSNLSDGEYILIVSYIGYDSVRIKIEIENNQTKDFPDTIQLAQTNKNLEQVIVTGKKNFVEFKPNQITLNVAQSPVATNGNAYDAIKLAPGIIETPDGLTFRGKKTLVLINGRQTYLTDADLKQMLTAMPATDIDKIQIVTSPSAKYDANAESVIDIRLAKNNSYGLNGTLIGGIGSGDQLRYNGGLNLNYRKGNINIYGGYNYEHNQQHYSMCSDRTFTSTDHILENAHENRVRYNNSYKAGIDYSIHKNSSAGILFTGYTNIRTRASTDNITIAHATPMADSFSTVTMNGHAQFSNPTINAYYKTTFDTSGKALTINADYFNFNKKWNDNYTTTYLDNNHVKYQPDYLLRDSSPGNNNVYSFAADYTNPFNNGRIDIGIKTTTTKTDNNVLWQYHNGTDWVVDTTQTNHFVYKENIKAAYISYDRKFGKYEITIGLRAEETTTRSNLVTKSEAHDSGYFGLFPNLRIQYAKNNNSIFSLSYHKNIVRPDFDVINPFIVYISQYSYFTGNPYLKPQLDHTINFSYTYKQSLNLAVGYTHSDNAIAGIVIAGSNNSSGLMTGNISTENAMSFSANWVGALSKIWGLSILNEADYAAFNQGATAGGTINNSGWVYQAQLQNIFKLKKGWTAELTAMYHSTIPSGVYILKPSFGSNMGIQKTMMQDKLRLALSLTDIFNTEVENYSTNFMGVNEKVKYKVESRFVKLQFTYRFGNKNVKQETVRASAIADINKRMKN
jgi:hypothetical protein